MDARAEPYRPERPFALEAQGHKLSFMPGGADRLRVLLELIESARETLRVCFYIYAADASGIDVRRALAAAAARGVKVSLIVDGFGADASEAFFAELVEAGGSYCCFSPRWNQRYLIRNHQKIVAVDGRIAMLGGFNVEDDYFAVPEQNGWEDLGFTVEGPVVAQVEAWFDRLHGWASDRHAKFKAIRRLVREWSSGDGPVQLLIGGPTRGLSSWARCVVRDLAHARQLDMVMAYFSPPYTLLRRIRRNARNGPSRLVLAAKSDNGATIGASRTLYSRLLRSGVKIWEFQPSKLHTKLIVLDDAVYLGSANLDMRSLYLNLEIVLKIEDAVLAERMRDYVAARIAYSEAVTPALHRRRATLPNRVRWWLSWVIVAVIDYTVSRRLNLGL